MLAAGSAQNKDAGYGSAVDLVLSRRCFISSANAAIQLGRESTSLTTSARSSGVAIMLANFRNSTRASWSGTSLPRPLTSEPERARNFVMISKSVCIYCSIKDADSENTCEINRSTPGLLSRTTGQFHASLSQSQDLELRPHAT